MKFLTFTLFSLAAAAPETIYSSRSVSAQVGVSSCNEGSESNIRSQRFTDTLTPGEYAFEATVTQTIELRENCDSISSTVQSTVVIADAILVGKEVTGEGCDVISDTQSIKGLFTVKDDGVVQFSLDTNGGTCAKVSVVWNDIEVKRCADRISKIERQLERSMTDLSEATRGISSATTDEEKALQKAKYDEATVKVATLRQELQYAITC